MQLTLRSRRKSSERVYKSMSEGDPCSTFHPLQCGRTVQVAILKLAKMDTIQTGFVQYRVVKFVLIAFSSKQPHSNTVIDCNVLSQARYA